MGHGHGARAWAWTRGGIAFYQRCGFRMLAVHRDFFAYVQPPQYEHGIAMRDMIVFSFDAADAAPAAGSGCA